MYINHYHWGRNQCLVQCGKSFVNKIQPSSLWFKYWTLQLWVPGSPCWSGEAACPSPSKAILAVLFGILIVLFFLLVTFYTKRWNIRNVLTILTQVICLNYTHFERYLCFSWPKKRCKTPHQSNCTYVFLWNHILCFYFAVVHFYTECCLSIFSSRLKLRIRVILL